LTTAVSGIVAYLTTIRTCNGAFACFAAMAKPSTLETPQRVRNVHSDGYSKEANLEVFRYGL